MKKARNGAPGRSEPRLIASGDGWRVVDIVCTYGPRDRPFEERFVATSISLVLAGSFIYRTARGATLMSAGTLMLGNCGSTFECSHRHREGDRCLSFQFERKFFEAIAREVGVKGANFENDGLPPLRELAMLNARARIAANSEPGVSGNYLEEIALDLVGAVIPLASGTRQVGPMTRTRDLQGIAHAVHQMEISSALPLSIKDLAREAGLSRYHFLRTFKRAIGVTPHQWLLRTRLRRAAGRLVESPKPITEIALEVGFEDLSNFIRSFHAEFGVSPSRYRKRPSG